MEFAKNGLWKMMFLIVLIIVILFFSKSTITDHISKNIERQVVDIVVDKSQSFVLSLPDNAIFSLRSLQISGEVVGSGKVKVFLDNGKGIKRLVFSNVQGVGKNIGVSTDFVDMDKSLQEIVINNYRSLENDLVYEGETFAGSFRRVCSETCELNPVIFTNKRYELLVYVEPGTKVYLKELLYT